MNSVYSYCLQGDVTGAYKYLLANAQTAKEKQLLKKYYNRFFVEKPLLQVESEDLWIKKVIFAYYHYFITVLTNKDRIAEAEDKLLYELKGLILNKEDIDNLDQAEDYLKTIFKEKGYHFLGGITFPFRGPYIWRTMDKREYDVELPHGEQKLKVHFMSDFILHSWLHFATFGIKATGGWADKEAIYCVYDSYKDILHTEDFTVSFLKHEAQHFRDYQQFPNLGSKDLEYRAKLVELIYHPSDKLLQKFLAESKNDASFPHSYSSYKIMSKLSTELLKVELSLELDDWFKLDKQVIKDLARAMFNEHTDKLIQNGSTEVKEAL